MGQTPSTRGKVAVKMSIVATSSPSGLITGSRRGHIIEAEEEMGRGDRPI